MSAVPVKYALIQWEDHYKDVLCLSKILEPRKPFGQYAEGEYIEARYEGKTYSARISELGGDRGVLLNKAKSNAALKYSYEERDTTCTRKRPAVLSSLSDDDNERDTTCSRKRPAVLSSLSDDDNERDTTCSRKRVRPAVLSSLSDDDNETDTEGESTAVGSKNVKIDEAKQAKAAEGKRKRETAASFLRTNADLSSDILRAQKSECSSCEENITRIEALEEKIDKLVGLVESFSETLSGTVRCRECLRDLYKEAKKEITPCKPTKPQTMVSPKASFHPVLPALLESGKEPLPPKLPEPEIAVDPEAENDNEPVDNDGLVYLGDSRHGFQIAKACMDAVMAASKAADTKQAAVKFALNVTEVLLSKDDCHNLTVYGNQGKRAMDPNMRRAIRSHIVLKYLGSQTKEENDKFWMETVVYKMNTKIRGMRNGKYKLQ